MNQSQGESNLEQGSETVPNVGGLLIQKLSASFQKTDLCICQKGKVCELNHFSKYFLNDFP
jgi:hypothetical protein